jgi:hypothetical protein
LNPILYKNSSKQPRFLFNILRASNTAYHAQSTL